MSTQSPPDIASLSRLGRKRSKRLWLWLLPLLALLAGGAWFMASGSSASVVYDTREVTRGELLVTVVATGTVQPTTKVEISSELSGTLQAVEVDFNALVSEGQVLAKLDDTKLAAQVLNSEAGLQAARARQASAEATVTEAADTLDSAQALDRRGLNTRSVNIASRAAYDRAVASVEIARADVSLAEANLASAQADLDKAVIRSPINGIVLDRLAEKGQIVAASLNAPILFTLAEDLRRMELRVAIDEADIGRVEVGQEATFTVDAYAGRSFDAVIASLRYAPDATGTDVVTYTAVLTVENDELLLRPGMTATATITVSREVDQLLVPVTALRYAPPATVSTSRSGRGLMGYIMPSPPGRGGARGTSADGSGVWILRNGAPLRVRATPGASDGSNIVVVSDELQAGDAVILSQREAS